MDTISDLEKRQIISEHMKAIRGNVKPENCRRGIKELRKAQEASVKARLLKKEAK